MIIKLVDKMIERHVINEIDKDECVYVLTLYMEKFITYSALFVIAFISGKVFYGGLYAVSFVALRQTTGGYHLNSFLGCLSGTILLFFLTLEVFVPFFEGHLWFRLVWLGVSVIIILVFAPVNHPNLMLSDIEKRDCKRFSRIVLFVELFLISIGEMFKMCWQQYIVLGVITCAVLILTAKLSGQEVKRIEESK